VQWGTDNTSHENIFKAGEMLHKRLERLSWLGLSDEEIAEIEKRSEAVSRQVGLMHVPDSSPAKTQQPPERGQQAAQSARSLASRLFAVFRRG
jgi:hypothetical protein